MFANRFESRKAEQDNLKIASDLRTYEPKNMSAAKSIDIERGTSGAQNPF